MEVLVRIKRLIAGRKYRFSEKALDELDRDGLVPQDAIESVLNAQTIAKSIKSTSPQQRRAREMLYVIESFSYTGQLIYTKGKIAREAGETVYYFFISAKASHYHE